MNKCEMCGSGNCGCGSCGCGKSSKKKDCCETGDPMCDQMVEMADKAWEALMMEKMKDLWQSQMGEKMDKIAEASVETSMAFHMNQMKSKMEVGEAANKIKESFA